MNKLYYGDNLTVLKNCFDDESVDLIYLDPPFNSQATYNVLFKSTAGEQSRAQIEAFGDTWHWGEEAELAFDGVMMSGNSDAAEMLRAMRSFLKENDMMAYLSMMAVRLLELRRVLKPTGSLYLHCDPTASHYLKIMMDSIFGVELFRNEIMWKRTNVHSDSKDVESGYGHDICFTRRGTYSLGITPHRATFGRTHRHEVFATWTRRADAIRSSNMSSPAPRPNMMYECKGFTTPPNGWRYSSETMERLDDEGRVWYPRTKIGDVYTSKRPRLNRYLDEMPGNRHEHLWTIFRPSIHRRKNA